MCRGGHVKKYKLKIQKYTGTNPNTKNVECRNTKGAGSYLQLPLRLRKGGGSQLGPSNRHKPDSGRTKHQVGTCEHQVRIVSISRRWDGTLRLSLHLWGPLWVKGWNKTTPYNNLYCDPASFQTWPYWRPCNWYCILFKVQAGTAAFIKQLWWKMIVQILSFPPWDLSLYWCNYGSQVLLQRQFSGAIDDGSGDGVSGKVGSLLGTSLAHTSPLSHGGGIDVDGVGGVGVGGGGDGVSGKLGAF